jgi:hypothetical protein
MPSSARHASNNANSERFSSSALAVLKDVDRFGQLAGLPGAAAEFTQDALACCADACERVLRAQHHGVRAADPGEFEPLVDQAVADSTRDRRCRSAWYIWAAIGCPPPRQRNEVDSVH